MSRGFLSALAGVGLTLLAWYGPWAWPAWPAFVVIETVFGSHAAFAELAFSIRAAVVVALIVVNVGVWGGIVYLLSKIASRWRTGARAAEAK